MGKQGHTIRSKSKKIDLSKFSCYEQPTGTYSLVMKNEYHDTTYTIHTS
jgi:hypothetical protein